MMSTAGRQGMRWCWKKESLAGSMPPNALCAIEEDHCFLALDASLREERGWCLVAHGQAHGDCARAGRRSDRSDTEGAGLTHEGEEGDEGAVEHV